MGIHRRFYALTLAAVLSMRSAAAASMVATEGYRLNGHAVSVPSTAMHGEGPQGLFVTATRESLSSALGAAGWSPSEAHTRGAWTFSQPRGEHRTTAALGDRVLAWAVAKNNDGPGQVWFVRLLHPSGGGASASASGVVRPDAELALKAVFLTGTSRLAAALPAKRGTKPLSWVRLRHAPGELRLATQTEAQGGEAGPVHAATAADSGENVAVAACLEREADAPEKAAYQPEPAAGPTCEGHGTLPLSPLGADKVADWVVWHSAPLGKQVALTFDACSTFAIGRFNPRVVASLRAEKVPATLFVGGHWAEMYPQVLEDLAADPLFELGNHTYSHPHMRELSTETQRQELLWTQELIFKRTGKTPRLFRPPYGEVDDTLVTTAAKAGLYTVEYDLPAGDADDHVTKAHLVNWVVGHSNPGSIVVMHMCRPNGHTADALPQIVRSLRQRGYKFCQVSDMLFHGGKQCL